jgi:hypothetical protein
MQRRKQLVTVLALTAALAAIVPTAQAIPNELAGNDRAHYSQSNDSTGPAEIPYLSHGVGVNKEDFRVGAAATTSGIGVDDRALPRGPAVEPTPSGIGVDDRALPRGPSVEPTPIVVTKDDGWSVDFGSSYIAALALMLGLLAGGTLVAVWNNRRTKLSPA